jgi:hypothetical protein
VAAAYRPFVPTPSVDQRCVLHTLSFYSPPLLVKVELFECVRFAPAKNGGRVTVHLEPEVRDAVLGNTGTLMTFRLGAADAASLEKEFAPELSVLDLTTLPNYHVYLKVMVDGEVTRPFSAETLMPLVPVYNADK